MEPIILSLAISSLFTHTLSLEAEPAKPNSQITVMGMVYCDICSNNSFSRHSYFLPGVEVKIDCKFKAISPTTAEEISFSVNRTTNRLGVYKLEIPSVEGVECAVEKAVESLCQASLIRSSSFQCNVPGYKTTSDQISFKSRQANLCIYSLNALSYRPARRSKVLC
ncbi:hypothetical protein Nepgr_016890 [Nepenthes gracilis]|uniref:Uncharacterized protein n=1 Tax=Nepenthes gracilis TaxID=150966 RepID=A0AAD3SQJ1_NEPGR|nr:hypothetical protein Nepgr_016890 [Nepenthes gracilis]